MDLFCRLTYAMGINQGTEEEAEVHLRLYHSTQNGQDQSSNVQRINAMIMFLTAKYIDVSGTN